VPSVSEYLDTVAEKFFDTIDDSKAYQLTARPYEDCADQGSCVSARNVLAAVYSTTVDHADAGAAFEAHLAVSGILLPPQRYQ
jgi:hypothetical protein